MEAYRLAHESDGGAALAAPGRLPHRHCRQLRVWLLLVFLPGRHHSVRSQDDGHHEHRGCSPGRNAKIRSTGRATVERTSTSTLLQRAPGHDGRWTEQLSV